MAAVITDCGTYRYSLTRRVGEGDGILTFVMLNPSTADAEQDDATIRKCRGFCSRLGYGVFEVVNLFAFRSTDPKNLKAAPDPVGPDNSHYIRLSAAMSDKIICAWGTYGAYGRQNEKIMAALTDYDLYALDITKDGHPKHPLYIPYDKTPILMKAKS